MIHARRDTPAEPNFPTLVYLGHEKRYISSMATILTIDQQRTAGLAVDKAGGWDEVIRLEAERRAAKGKGRVLHDARTGRFVFSKSLIAR